MKAKYKSSEKYIADIDAAYANATSYDELFFMLDEAARDVEPHTCFGMWESGEIDFHCDVESDTGFEMPITEDRK